jgi:hypothetical protein
MTHKSLGCRRDRRWQESIHINCIVGHGADGTGKMGPTLVGKDVVCKQMLTDPGMFANLAEPVVRCSRSIAAA